MISIDSIMISVVSRREMMRFCLSSGNLRASAWQLRGPDVQMWLGFPHGLVNQDGRPSLDAMTSLMDIIVMRPRQLIKA